VPVYGGAEIRPQLVALHRGAHIVVATPGRMVDLLRRRSIEFSKIRRVVLDEAEEMLTMGFEEDLETILSAVPEGAQTLLFSATMPRNVASIARQHMTDAEEITIGAPNAGPDQVVHEAYIVHARDRYPAHKRIVDLIQDLYGIVFCRTRQETQEIADGLIRDGYNAQALHGDLNQTQRDRVMKKFRDRDCPLLVATDVAARGLDVRNLTHIINYSLPDDLDVYTHRSGRTGRAGQMGISMVLLHMREHFKLSRIEKKLGQKFISRPVPTGEDICRVRLHDWMKRWQSQDAKSPLLDELMPSMCEHLKDLTREELLRKVAFQELHKLLDYYQDQPDLQTEHSGNLRSRPPELLELVLNVGAVNGANRSSLMAMIREVGDDPQISFGRINVAKMQSYVEIPAPVAEELVRQFESCDIQLDGRAVRVAIAGPSRPPMRSGGRSSTERPQRYDWHASARSRSERKPGGFAKKRRNG
ncbi:MAG: DEAD/DEAH box helicase, partial [Kiritimatiellia bacterium]|nr:DEAD/DEAH box helicase [Kiritimatiellia bacterium]